MIIFNYGASVHTIFKSIFFTAFGQTSLGNRDDGVRVLMCDSDGGVGDLRQQVDQVTYAVVNYPPVSREAPDVHKV